MAKGHYIKKKYAHTDTKIIHNTFSSIPTRIMSFCCTKPVPNTMALGGVATGNIKAQDAPIPITNTNTSLGIPICVAMLAKIGTNKAAEAVLLVNSVKKMMKAATTKITTNGCATVKALAIC